MTDNDAECATNELYMLVRDRSRCIDTQTLEHLLDRGANLFATDEQGISIALWAIYHKHPVVVGRVYEEMDQVVFAQSEPDALPPAEKSALKLPSAKILPEGVVSLDKVRAERTSQKDGRT